jgi:hypothetical protein
MSFLPAGTVLVIRSQVSEVSYHSPRGAYLLQLTVYLAGRAFALEYLLPEELPRARLCVSP